MVHNKRKKNSRHRGSWTHSWGEKKKHRGAGSRGGRGNAGSGKRGDSKKPTFHNAGRIWGGRGFSSHKTKGTSLNVAALDAIRLEGKKGVDITKDGATIDLTVMGYTKLLGAGSVSGKYTITVAAASPSAIDKIKAAGGSVTTTSQPATPQPATPQPATQKAADQSTEE